MGPRMMNIDGDLGRHITIGETILDQLAIPTMDLFSHSMYGEPLTPHEWLAQVIFALAHRWMGLDGVVFLTALVLAAAFYVVLRLVMIQDGGLPLLSLAVTILAAAASSLHWLTRPHIFTILFCAIWLYHLEAVRTCRSNKWWIFPVLMLVWVNLHGAFIAGFVITGVVLAGEMWELWIEQKDQNPDHRRRVIGLISLGAISSFFVTFINPAGIKLWSTSLGYIRNQYLVSHTAEYLPPNFHDSSTFPFLLMIVLLIVLIGYSRRKLPVAWLGLVGAWTGMGLYSVRNIPLFAVSAAPALAFLGAGILQEIAIFQAFRKVEFRLIETEKSLRGSLWPILVVIITGLLLNNQYFTSPDQSINRFDPEVFPVEAVDWLESHPVEGNVFNYFPWGGYLLYREWPGMRVFIDGQTDFYGEELTREYEEVITLGQDWQAVLGKYDVQWVIMPNESLLAEKLELLNDDWQLAYQDSTADIFVRRLP